MSRNFLSSLRPAFRWFNKNKETITPRFHNSGLMREDFYLCYINI